MASFTVALAGSVYTIKRTGYFLVLSKFLGRIIQPSIVTLSSVVTWNIVTGYCGRLLAARAGASFFFIVSCFGRLTHSDKDSYKWLEKLCVAYIAPGETL